MYYVANSKFDFIGYETLNAAQAEYLEQRNWLRNNKEEFDNVRFFKSKEAMDKFYSRGK